MENENIISKTVYFDIKLNIQIINNLKDHLEILLNYNIIEKNKYNLVIEKIKFLSYELNNQLRLFKILNKLFLSINFEKKNDELDIKIDNIELNLISIKNELIKIIFDYGYISINNILNIINNIFYEKNKTKLNQKLDLINNYFQVTKVEKIKKIYSENTNIKIKNILPKIIKKQQKMEPNNPNENLNPEIKEDIDINNNENLLINLVYELNKAIIEIDIGDSYFIFTGFFKEDILNEIYHNDIFYIKYKNIENKIFNKKIENKNNLKIFFKEYMTQLSIKDLIILDEEEIKNNIENQYILLKKYDKLSIYELLNKFIEINIYEKREMIILLLLDEYLFDTILEDDMIEDDLIKNNLVNQMSLVEIFDIENMIKIPKTNDDLSITTKFNNNINTINLNPLSLVKLNKSTATRYSINSIMKNFNTNNEKKNLKTIIDNSKKILNANILMDFLRNSLLKSYEYINFINSIHWNYRKKIFAKATTDSKQKITEEITWETRLSLMEINEKTKDKVNEKIREFRSSRDNSKAETFIEIFFKIPFGKYIKEDIFIKSINSDIKMKNYINKINLFIDNEQLNINDTFKQLENKIMYYRLLDNSEEINNYYIRLVEEKKKIIKEKKLYLEKIDTILEDAIYGHIESKREIKRLIAQWMGGKMEGIILGFHGPPGVGKTCFAKKGISKCLFDSNGNSRPFCIFQLGGANDGSILEGHSYTYMGAKPGRLVEFLQESKCMNPIIYFDELDKISETDKGNEIVNILIHLTDKSQNKEIYDKYFSGIELDFSKCIIIFSYNDVSKVNKILRDRITEIKINPLKKKEKIIITNKYTLKEISEELNYKCVLSDDLTEYIIDNYTMESGVRKLNEKLYEIFREINLRILENPIQDIIIDKELIDDILSRHYKIINYKIHSKPHIGLVNGLYASNIGLGGCTLIQIKKNITSSESMPLELTGQQGNIMKESMSCSKTVAINLLTLEEKKLLLAELKSTQFGLHVHCPDGATPKDGPSAGIAITVGIYSVLTGKLVRNDIAMTGEIDLLGNIKAIGGLDAKINGAIKAGVKKVIFPKENEQDWNKIIKDNLLDEKNGTIEIIMVERIEEVINIVIIK